MFSTLDLKESFYSVELSPANFIKSAIIAPWELYEYLRSNFGLKGIMNVYCIMIESVLGHIRDTEAINYVNDSIVLVEDVEKHPINIDKTMD